MKYVLKVSFAVLGLLAACADTSFNKRPTFEGNTKLQALAQSPLQGMNLIGDRRQAVFMFSPNTEKQLEMFANIAERSRWALLNDPLVFTSTQPLYYIDELTKILGQTYGSVSHIRNILEAQRLNADNLIYLDLYCDHSGWTSSAQCTQSAYFFSTDKGLRGTITSKGSGTSSQGPFPALATSRVKMMDDFSSQMSQASRR